MKKIKYSSLFNKEYNEIECIRIVNTKQAGLYIKHKIIPKDIYWDKETLVFVFNKNDTKLVYDLWCRHELN